MVKQKTVQVPGKCIFCGRPGSLSKQHILPDRLRHLIPRKYSDHIRNPFVIRREAEGIVADGQDPRRIDGAMGAKKLRIVCKPCNEGWMEGVERRAFEVLEPLIKGEDVYLTQELQARISAICAIIFTMIDRDHLPTSSVGQAECSYIYENRMPPPTWNIFLGRVKACKWEFRFAHWGAISAPVHDPKMQSSGYDLQICTIGLKNLLLHVVSHKTDNVLADVGQYAEMNRIIPIHQFVREFRFSDLKRLRNDTADIVANSAATLMFQTGTELLR